MTRLAWAPNGRDLIPWPAGRGYALDRDVREEFITKAWRARRAVKASQEPPA